MISALAPPRPLRSRYTQGHCRRCGAYELHRTRAKTLPFQLASLATPLVPMRCPACGTRTLRLPSAARPRARAPAPAAATSRRQKSRSRRAARRRRRALRFAGFYALVLSLAAALGYLASRG